MISEVVEAEGHLIDSQLLNVMFDTVVRHEAAFEVLEFRIGRTNDEPSFVSMRVTTPTDPVLDELLAELVALGCRVARAEDARTIPADRDGCAPDDFYSTTNHQTFIQRGGRRSHYDLSWRKPRPFCLRRHSIEIEERITSDGSVIAPLDKAQAKAALKNSILPWP